MILQYIFSMAISTNLFATLILFSVSVQFEFAIQFFPFALHISECHTLWYCFDMGVELRDGGVYNRPGHASLDIGPRRSSQLIQAPLLSRCMWVDQFYSLVLKHACFHFS